MAAKKWRERGVKVDTENSRSCVETALQEVGDEQLDAETLSLRLREHHSASG